MSCRSAAQSAQELSINYRLAAEGFLFLDDGIANVGLLNQVAALQWVRDNISAFGGEPARVTVAGGRRAVADRLEPRRSARFLVAAQTIELIDEAAPGRRYLTVQYGQVTRSRHPGMAAELS